MSPQNCKNENCDYIAKWKDSGENTEFVISTKVEDLTNMWLGLGFSLDQSMVCINNTFKI